MKQNKKPAILYNPMFQVVATWVWFVLGAFSVIFIISAARGVSFTKA